MQAPFSPDTVFRQSNRISSGSTIQKDGSLHRKRGSHRWQSAVADRYSQPARRYSCFGRVVQLDRADGTNSPLFTQENKEATREKASQVAEKLRAMKLAKAAKKVEDGIEETLTYMDFPTQHWTRIRTNNAIERLNREIKRRTKAIGAFPDGQSALMLVCARLRHVAATSWGARRYMNMDHLFKSEEDLLSDIIAG